MNWVLACDFGTSNTTAAEIDEDGRIRAIGLEDQGTSMPSAVALTPSGTRVGQSAVNAQLVHPDGFEAAPKALIGQEDVVLGGRFVKPQELVEAVYETVRKVALARHNGREPRELWLTHPVAWAPSQLEVLRRAAAAAGFDSRAIRLVPEPIAAATHYATSRAIPPGARVSVFDFGGGTLDIAVLERAPQEEGGYRVLAYGGDPLLGGRSFDNRLMEWALRTAREAGQEDLAERVENPKDPKELRAKLALRRAVTAAKVELSTHADADIPMSVGELEHVVTITRDEYEQLISSDVERGGKLVRDVLDRVSGRPPEAIYLTGGSSRTPSIARMLHRVTGLIPATFDDPKLVVSEGALRVRPAVTVGRAQRPSAPVPAIGGTPGIQGPMRPGGTGAQPALRPAPGPQRGPGAMDPGARQPSPQPRPQGQPQPRPQGRPAPQAGQSGYPGRRNASGPQPSALSPQAARDPQRQGAPQPTQQRAPQPVAQPQGPRQPQGPSQPQGPGQPQGPSQPQIPRQPQGGASGYPGGQYGSASQGAASPTKPSRKPLIIAIIVIVALGLLILIAELIAEGIQRGSADGVAAPGVALAAAWPFALELRALLPVPAA